MARTFTVPDAVNGGTMEVTQRELWTYLKAERILNDMIRQVVKADGLTALQKQEANRGRRPAPMKIGRAARRRMGRFTRVAV